MSIAENFDGKKVLIFGFGAEGRSTLDYILRHSHPEKIGVADSRFIDGEGLSGISLHTGASAEDACEEYDIVVKSPGVVFSKPHDMSRVTSQTQLFLQAFRDRVIGVTGTKGKSTTSSLIAHFLRQKYEKVFLGGNIGLPVFDLADRMDDSSLLVFEMSCHQLEFATLSPHVAVYLNLYPEHLDHYGTFEKYAAAKANIVKYQTAQDFAFIGDTCGVASAAAPISPRAVGFDREKCRLKGDHNAFDISVAAGVASLFGVSDEDVTNAVYTFSPLPHRLEPLGAVDGVEYYNDSISTIPQTAISALIAVKNVHTLILGGMDRGISYVPLVTYLCKNPVPLVILMPDTGAKIGIGLAAKGFGGEVRKAQNLEEAVRMAKEKTPAGKAVLFSPAAASYGFFKNFEERGERFKALVFNK